MEKEKTSTQTEKEQLIVLSNRKNISISGTTKIISLKPDLIQLDTVYGLLQVEGNNLELVKLDNATSRAELCGKINSLKFMENKNKEPLFRKIFKWYMKLKTKLITY